MSWIRLLLGLCNLAAFVISYIKDDTSGLIFFGVWMLVICIENESRGTR